MTARLLAAAAAALLLGLAPSALAQDPNDTLPDGPGKAELVGGCTGCHDATTISGQARTPDAWERVIGQMINDGADLTPEQQALVYAYVVKNFGLKPGAPAPSPSEPKAQASR
jgi:hypothetical protein